MDNTVPPAEEIVSVPQIPVIQQSDVRLADYAPPAFLVDSVGLHFDLHPQKTLVYNRMQMRRNPEVATQEALRLDGDDLHLSRITINNQAVRCALENEHLVVTQLPHAEDAHARCG